MKANELMIGDWVYMKAHRGFDSQYIKVETIPDSSSDTHYGHIGAYPISEDMDFRDIEDSHLEPIPLTPEILEKNGFTNVGEKVWQWEEKPFWVWWEEETHHLGIEIDDSSYEEEKSKMIMIIVQNYIHELQHAIRLCGIDKTIVI